MHNLFFALRPDSEAALRFSQLADDLRRRRGLTGSPIPPERLHIALYGLIAEEHPPGQVIDKACELVSSVSIRSFVVALNQVVAFRTRTEFSPLVVTGDDGVIGVFNLRAAIHAALADAGLKRRPEKAFTPHVTLLWDRRTATEEFIDPISWRVQEFILIDSTLGQSRHDVLGRWPLTG